MTKEITKAKIIQEIQDKFKLREFEPEPFTFSERVVPVYNVGQHIVYRTARYNQISVVSGPAGYIIKVIPQNERWTLRGYNVIFMAAGAYKVTGIYIVRAREEFPDSSIYLDMKKGQTESYIVNLPVPVVLEPGDEIYVYIDEYTSTAYVRLYIDYTKEELR